MQLGEESYNNKLDLILLIQCKRELNSTVLLDNFTLTAQILLAVGCTLRAGRARFSSSHVGSLSIAPDMNQQHNYMINCMNSHTLAT